MRRPRFIASQARHARGLLGWLIAFIMARETWAQNQRAVESLGVLPGDHVLDIGCGPGRSLAMLAAQARDGRVVGADPSQLMAEVAARRNRKLINSGQVDVVMASAASLPFEDGVFDNVLCVHVVYFWNDLAAAFAEIARVLKPGGQLALLFRTNADVKAVQAFPAEVYSFRSLADVIAPLEAAGFAVQTRDELCCEPQTAPVLLVATRRAYQARNAA
ncbi:MAG: methyltransferase domain-containing protein [Proteobacteria bacterium]|nr:methyltransferase domain-containing protein [Pseudomonadota bacterium]